MLCTMHKRFYLSAPLAMSRRPFQRKVWSSPWLLLTSSHEHQDDRIRRLGENEPSLPRTLLTPYETGIVKERKSAHPKANWLTCERLFSSDPNTNNYLGSLDYRSVVQSAALELNPALDAISETMTASIGPISSTAFCRCGAPLERRPK